MNFALEAELRSRLWAIRHETLGGILAGIAGRQMHTFAAPARRPSALSKGMIAVIPLTGPLDQRTGPFTALFGGTGLDRFNQALQSAVDDDTVSQILLDVDSPGGNVYGVSETAAAVMAARAKKPIVAIANSLAASAAYWIASQTDQVWITPGGEVGSIGVYTVHQDSSKAMDKLGVKTTLVSAGKYKTEGNPWQALDADASGFMQSRINDIYGEFTRAVARGRGVSVEVVRNGMGQGRCLGADQALAAKMVDGIATLDQLVRKMQTVNMRKSNLASAQAYLGALTGAQALH